MDGIRLVSTSSHLPLPHRAANIKSLQNGQFATVIFLVSLLGTKTSDNRSILFIFLDDTAEWVEDNLEGKITIFSKHYLRFVRFLQNKKNSDHVCMGYSLHLFGIILT